MSLPPRGSGPVVVEVEDLRFVYPDGHEALTGVDFTADAGEHVALLGPNGAGKTTFAHHLNGIHRATAGTVRIAGLPLDEEHLAEVRRRAGLVFQDADDMLFMPSVREDVAFGPANLGLRGEELHVRVEEALAAVEASELADRAPHHLSGGEKRRCALAAVLAMRPDLLVLDEPTGGLDPASRREVITLLGGLSQTLLVITHDLPLALELCERAVIMADGRIVADGPTHELLADEALLHANRLELPLGFDPTVVTHR